MHTESLRFMRAVEKQRNMLIIRMCSRVHCPLVNLILIESVIVEKSAKTLITKYNYWYIYNTVNYWL